MLYGVFILISLALFFGFLLLTRYERARGARAFERDRAALDAKVARLTFIATRVDFPAFIRDEIRALAARIVHDIAHGSLLLVRFVERLLTRAVRALRARHLPNGRPAAGAAPSPFVATIRGFKEELRNGRKPEEPLS